MLRIWSWNVNGRHLWDWFVASQVDLALLQETPAVRGTWGGTAMSNPGGTAGWSRPLQTAVVATSDATPLEPVPLTSAEAREAGALQVSRRGTLAAATVTVEGERITLISLYAGWETSALGGHPGTIYADAA